MVRQAHHDNALFVIPPSEFREILQLSMTSFFDLPDTCGLQGVKNLKTKKGDNHNVL
jgi:hypothetical protein